jgi:hypothetical protein
VRHLIGLVLAGGLVLGSVSYSEAQVAVSVGNPYFGQGLYIGSGYGGGLGYPGYGLGYPGYGVGYSSYGGFLPGYGLGYGSVSAPIYRGGYGAFGYSSGYRGFVGPGYGFA